MAFRSPRRPRLFGLHRLLAVSKSTSPTGADRARRIARDLFLSGLARDPLGGITDPDWNDLLTVVSPGLYPYVEYRLRSAGALTATSAGVQRALARSRQGAILSDLQRRSVLRDVLSFLVLRQIPAVLLKGAALANAVYPESYLRPMDDIDIWVPPSQLMAAVGCLLENGFDVPEGGLADARISPMLDQRRLRDVRSDIRVELHGSVQSLECLSEQRMKQCWERSVPVPAHGTVARMLCPEDALVHTCLHLAMTNRFAGSQLALLDVALLTDRWGGSLDWTAIARNASQEGIAVYLTIALGVAREVWGARVPDEYFAAIGDVYGLAEMKALALEQVWERSPRFPPALERAFRERAGATRLATLLRRVFVHPWMGSTGETRNTWQKVRQATDRLLIDVTVKLPSYGRAWARGDLARRELRRGAALAARRGRLGLLAREAEARIGGGVRR